MQPILKAISERQHLTSNETDILRLFDGIGDGIDGLFLDTFADRWLISTRSNQLDQSVRSFLENQQRSVYWKRLDQHEKESPQHIAGEVCDEPFTARENGVNYQIHFHAGYSQGIFPDQRLNRHRVRQLSRPGNTVLNTFAYTGAFSVCAALAGATTTTLDLSQVYLDWAKQNFSHNNLNPNDHYFCKGDTFHWLKRFARQGRQFDGIILDPPSFSRDDKGKVFRVEKDYHRLVQLASACLAPGGWILCCTNLRKLPMATFRQLVSRGAPAANIEELPMPEEYSEFPYLKSIWLTDATA